MSIENEARDYSPWETVDRTNKFVADRGFRYQLSDGWHRLTEISTGLVVRGVAEEEDNTLHCRFLAIQGLR